MTEDTNTCTLDVTAVWYVDAKGTVLAIATFKRPIRVWDKDSITATTTFHLVPK